MITRREEANSSSLQPVIGWRLISRSGSNFDADSAVCQQRGTRGHRGVRQARLRRIYTHTQETQSQAHEEHAGEHERRRPRALGARVHAQHVEAVALEAHAEHQLRAVHMRPLRVASAQDLIQTLTSSEHWSRVACRRLSVTVRERPPVSSSCSELSCRSVGRATRRRTSAAGSDVRTSGSRA